ncbi:MAG: thiamine phosphate synthase [Thermoguttaceae bacterium]|nr:thiamine phosphate synthase [Thermoguttaceae bacterium]MDW8079402.1 thiamine phosphate synthase [Thermoguttaceae bacterium]
MTTPDPALIRAIDANANRCREGLRVLEDIARFVLNDVFLTESVKSLRHELETALASVAVSARLQARDTRHDVGTSLSTPEELQRVDWVAIVVANARRVQEGLRTLEEFTKLVAGDVAPRIKAIRYRSYTLEKALAVVLSSRKNLEGVRLYVLVDARGSEEEFRHIVEGLVRVGVGAIQLRAKNVPDRLLLARARLLRQLTAERALCIINDRPDIALLVRADGIHLGQEDLPLAEVRRVVGPDMLVGISTHSLEQAETAVLEGANYIGVGPIFPSRTKDFTHFPGLEFARQVATRLAIPAFAIGGINLDNLPDVLATGISRVAVASAIVDAPEPAVEAAKFLRMLTSQGGSKTENKPEIPSDRDPDT